MWLYMEKTNGWLTLIKKIQSLFWLKIEKWKWNKWILFFFRYRKHRTSRVHMWSNWLVSKRATRRSTKWRWTTTSASAIKSSPATSLCWSRTIRTRRCVIRSQPRSDGVGCILVILSFRKNEKVTEDPNSKQFFFNFRVAWLALMRQRWQSNSSHSTTCALRGRYVYTIYVKD